MKNPLTFSGIAAFLLFVVLLFSHNSGIITQFDQLMADELAGNDFIEFFRRFGETSFTMLVCSILVVFFGYKRDYLKILFSTFAITGGYYLNQLLKRIVRRERPDIPNQYSTFSFPSGHAMVGILYIFTIAYFISSWTSSRMMKIITWVIAIIFTAFVGLSRVAGERHFPSDVIAGWALGYACFTFLVNWYRKGASKE